MSNIKSFLYPEIEPYNSGWLQVSSIHSVYYEEVGNPDGYPVLAIHDGPGGATQPHYRQYFDPAFYHLIMFDQRGCGISTPAFCILDNTTNEILLDMETLRKHLGVDRWLLWGYGWGGGLALLYAQRYIKCVSGLVLHGLFTFTQRETDWLFKEGGASSLLPDFWEKFVAPIPEHERKDLITAYFKRISGECGKLVAERCCRALSMWNAAGSNILKPERIKAIVGMIHKDCLVNPKTKLVYLHYFANKGFLEENEIWNKVEIIKQSRIPVTIVHGRHNVMSIPKTSWDLHKLLPKSELVLVPEASHSHCKMEGEDRLANMKAIVEVLDKFRTIL